MIHEQHSYIAT